MAQGQSIAWNAHVRDVSPAGMAELAQLNQGNTLVVFYAHWCGHCAALHAPLNELAKSGVNVVVVDTTAHRTALKAPFVEGAGVPQIFCPGSGAWVQHQGSREVAALRAFIRAQGSKSGVPLSGGGGGGGGGKGASKRASPKRMRGGAACFVEFEGGGARAPAERAVAPLSLIHI